MEREKEFSMKKNINKFFFLPKDQHLFDYDQIFSVSSMWVELGMENTEATYDLYVRGMPKNRNFLLFGGLEEIIEGILNWNFTKSEVDFLLKNEIITPKMAGLLKKYKFSGDIWAMPEGTVFFPEEPLVRITGKIWEVNLFTFFLINAVTSNSIFLSKAVRSFLATGDKIKVVTCPVTRAHSNEASLKFGRAVYLLGAPSAIVPAFARKYNLPTTKVNTKAYHAFISSFSSELEAMKKAVSVFPNISFMVDTYNLKQGIKNAISVAKEQQAKGRETLSAVVIDSGKNVKHFAQQARYARKELNKAGFKNIKVNLSGNFTENKLAELVKLKAPVNGVVICTDLVTSSDDPKMEVVLKLAEFKHNNEVQHALKLSYGKISLPGKKQVFRKLKLQKLSEDIIGLEEERLGIPMLSHWIKNGKLIKPLPNLDEIKKYLHNQLMMLPEKFRQVEKVYPHKVLISKKLQQLFKKAQTQHLQKTT